MKPGIGLGHSLFSFIPSIYG